jgi:UDP-N-acetylmuramoyl-tripeptide--D-alanyl-D-alanine ligase
MNRRGEIRHLSEVAKPGIGVITNIAPVHIGNFASLEEILTEKLEIASSSHTLLINADDDMLKGVIEDIKKKKRVITYGVKDGDVRAEDITLSPDGSRFRVNKTSFFLPLIGRHNMYNALVSIIIGDELGIDRKKTAAALEKAVPEEGRDRKIRIGDILIIDSTYNSNPVSLVNLLETLRLLKGRKIAVLGDMLELGEEAVQFHREIGKKLSEFDIQALFTYGKLAREFVEDASVPFISSYDDISYLAYDLKGFVKAGDIILIKGSRKMKMERVVGELGKGVGRGAKEVE